MQNSEFLWEIAYLLGDLGQNLTGDAKHETGELLNRLHQSPLADRELHDLSISALAATLGMLRSHREDRIRGSATLLWVLYDSVYRNNPQRLKSNSYILQEQAGGEQD